MPPPPTKSIIILGAVAALAALAAACSGDGPRQEVPAEKIFTLLPPSYTGVDFENRLTDTEDYNVFTYRNYFNGGGVGIGDVNGDSLPDLYLTANQAPNRLFLNRGGFRFEDVTGQAGVAGTRAWSTGVSMVDLNADGLLDIYVSNAGNIEGDDRANELFINQGPGTDGIPVFTESAADYGIADAGYTTHAAFFDYDRDGDLDLYVLNNSFRPVTSFGLQNIRHVRDEKGGDRLYRNDGGRFADVSEQADIFGSEIAFGLGVTVGDVNRDGWPDIYISNDFFERDYLYLNGGDGSFDDVLETQMPHISLSSMGADLGDLNNDGFPELYVTDMLPESDRRLKTTSSFESWGLYEAKVENGFHHQLMRNTLQLNNTDGTFSDISAIAGVSATDWSWSALMADFDNDGNRDIFVSNGVFKDVTDQDFIQYFAGELNRLQTGRASKLPFLALLDKIPSHPLPNYLFANAGDLTFKNVAAEWGLDAPGFSNGSAYGDFDNDGDLDLVVNNVNQQVSVYRNETGALRDHSYLKVRLEGDGQNRQGLGAQVTLHRGENRFYAEQMPTRGFQSSVDPVLAFGLGAVDTLDTVVVQWPDGRVEVRADVPANRTLTFRQEDAAPAGDEWRPRAEPSQPRFVSAAALAPEYTHTENAFVDFDRQPLMPRMLSTEGPMLAVADVNGDGLDDVFVGGPKDAPGQMFVQRRGGGFTPVNTEVFEADKASEDTGTLFFDADGDGDQDLLVVSGGTEFNDRAPALQDRLYLNDGRGGFTLGDGLLPRDRNSGSRAAAADYDGDGDLDLFIGGRSVPGRYGDLPQSALLRNDGRGAFADVTVTVAPALKQVGMVTDAVWTDYDADGRADLILAGEWMPVTVFRNTGDGVLALTAVPGLENSHGWWNRLLPADIDGDGDVDFVAGNLGLNTRLRAAPGKPAAMVVSDFDFNGSLEQVISYYKGENSYPMALRDELGMHLPALSRKYARYADYAEQGVQDIFTPAQLEQAAEYRAYRFETSYIENKGNGAFEVKPLPYQAQIAPVYGILAEDFDGDGYQDLLLGGNFFGFKPDIGRADAGYGLLLKGDGKGGFTPLPAAQSGINITGQVRDLQLVEAAGGGKMVLVARNGDSMLAYRPL